jgi:hypothetical protein
LQASFADLYEHRHNIGDYFMSVNERGAYEFILPHSEGSAFVGMEIAAFYCFENSTDGGETILMHIDPDSREWGRLRQRAARVRPTGEAFYPQQIARAKVLYQLNLLSDTLNEDDEILGEFPTEIQGLTIVDVLTKPSVSYSRILDRELYAYWDNIAAIDCDSADEFVCMLKHDHLLHEPQGGLPISQMNHAARRGVYKSGLRYLALFDSLVIRKLQKGDFLLFNNMTWTHATTNWTPGSGRRYVAAAFA